MEQKNLVIRRETPADYAAVEHLTREAFWNVYRPGCTSTTWSTFSGMIPAFFRSLTL